MKPIFKLTFCFILFFFCTVVLFCQTKVDTISQPQTVIVHMKNGDEFAGTILVQDSTYITLASTNGEMKLIKSNIKSIEETNIQGRYRFPNPNSSSYYLAPSAFQIEKNKFIYHNILLFFNSLEYGITEHISVSGGFEYISTILGKPIWFLSAKGGGKVANKLHVVGGGLLIGFSDSGKTGLAYGAMTYGSKESNITAGLGYGIASGNISDSPAFVLCATQRISNSISLVTENYFFPNEIIHFGTHGIRILASSSAFDIGLMLLPDADAPIPGIPFVGYARKF